MTTYTTVLMVDGHRAGGQSDATIHDVRNLIIDECGLDQKFMDRLLEDGHAVSVESYRVFPWDKADTVSILVAYRNQ